MGLAADLECLVMGLASGLALVMGLASGLALVMGLASGLALVSGLASGLALVSGLASGSEAVPYCLGRSRILTLGLFGLPRPLPPLI